MANPLSGNELFENWAESACKELASLYRLLGHAGVKIPNKIKAELLAAPFIELYEKMTEANLDQYHGQYWRDEKERVTNWHKHFDHDFLENGPQLAASRELPIEQQIEIEKRNCLNLSHLIGLYRLNDAYRLDSITFKRLNGHLYVILSNGYMLFAEYMIKRGYKLNGLLAGQKTPQVKSGKKNRATIEALWQKHGEKETAAFRREAREKTGLKDRQIDNILKKIKAGKA